MVAKVILNPYSNRWNAEKRWPQAESALRTAGLDFELAVSQYRHHVIELAEEAARQGFSPIIAAGGDGTIGETVNGLARAAASDAESLGPMGILPLGTANDLVSNLGLPLNLDEAARLIAAGHTRLLDVCRANQSYFVNNSAIGLEPYVTVLQEKITWVKGIPRYLLAALWAIADKRAWSGQVEWDGGSYQGLLSLVSVGNCARTGGLFYMSPHADPFDGRLTFVYGYRSTRWQLLATLPRTMKPDKGSYVEMADIHEIHTDWLKIHLEQPAPANSDGEMFSEWVQDLEYRILPGRLKLLMPEQKPD